MYISYINSTFQCAPMVKLQMRLMGCHPMHPGPGRPWRPRRPWGRLTSKEWEIPKGIQIWKSYGTHVFLLMMIITFFLIYKTGFIFFKPQLTHENHGNQPSSQWKFQDPIDWRYLPYTRPMYQAYGSGHMPPIYGLIWLTLHFRILEFPLKIRAGIEICITYPLVN